MKKHEIKIKILTLFLAINFLAPSHIVFSAELNNKNIKPASKQLKVSVSDYRIDYINIDWWDKFQDPVLKEYILKAVNENYDLKIATFKVLETQEMVRESLGKEFPLMDIGGDFARKKTSGNIGLPSYSQNTYLFPLNVNYELDLWRKNRERTIQKGKELEAVKYDEKASYISLSTIVAAAYFNIIKTDKQILLQKEIISLREEILKLSKINYDYGLYQTSDVISEEKALTEAQSALNDLEKQQSIFLNQLSVLTGQYSDNSSKLKRASIDEIDLINDLPANIKAEVVKNRPDILKAEAELQKSRIDVSLARKDFFPDLSITGQFGFNANSLSKAFNWESYVASVGVGIIQNIFSGGQRKARLKAKKYHYEQMLGNYQKTILTSFQEVNDSLTALKFDIQKNNNNIARIKSEKDNLNIINMKYEKGALSYLDTLQYKERMLSLEKEQVQSKTDCLIDSLSLYKTIGGKI
ncbi:MAG: efflux transporter outer membrane subunit [bacterium]